MGNSGFYLWSVWEEEGDQEEEEKGLSEGEGARVLVLDSMSCALVI